MLHESEYPATVSMVQMEYQLAYIESNPELFRQSYNKFFNEHEGWNISAKATKGTLTLIAERIKKEGK